MLLGVLGCGKHLDYWLLKLGMVLNRQHLRMIGYGGHLGYCGHPGYLWGNILPVVHDGSLPPPHDGSLGYGQDGGCYSPARRTRCYDRRIASDGKHLPEDIRLRDVVFLSSV